MDTVQHPPIELRLHLQRSHQHRARFALDIDVNLPGQGITAIFGASGAGKTTLLRYIAGLEVAQSGFLRVNGHIWQDHATRLPTHQRPLGYVFQEASLLPHLTAAANLQYAITRAPKATSHEAYQHILDIMGITTILKHYPHQLSGGERQRVAIARALLIQPQILLMDEPLAALDKARKQEILPYLERLREEINIPILYVSHAIEEVARLADHMLILDAGRVYRQGLLSDVLAQLDEASLLADEQSVVLTGHFRQRDARWQLVLFVFDGGELWVRDSGQALNQRGRVRILAKDVSLSRAHVNDSSILNRLAVRIDSIDNGADNGMARIGLITANTRLVAHITQRSGAELELAVGQQLWAQIKSVAILG